MPENSWTEHFEEIHREVEQMLRRFLTGQPSLGVPVGEAWKPPTDILETEDKFLVRMEMAGVLPEDLSVSVTGHLLEVRGVRRFRPLDEGFRFQRAEIYYGAFVQRVEITDAVDRDRTTATYRNGLLEVVLPKLSGLKIPEVDVEGE